MIERAAGLLRSGEPVAIPTETVYGLAANAFEHEAVLKVFRLKQRPLFDPLIVHVAHEQASLAALAQAGVVDSSGMTEGQKTSFARLTAALWPGPLTVVLPRGKRVVDLVSSGLSTVGVRVPAHPLTQQLLKALPFPLAAPSANRFGRVSPTTAQHVTDEFGKDLAMVMDGGACETGVESTVVLLLAGGDPLILRPGGISREVIEKLTGRRAAVQSTAGGSLVGVSPGTMDNHYAPTIPLILWDGASPVAASELPLRGLRVALLSVESSTTLEETVQSLGGEVCHREILSTRSSDLDAARHLFAALRRCGTSGASVIVAQKPGRDDGLWLAIADRLRKASFKGELNGLLSQLRGSR